MRKNKTTLVLALLVSTHALAGAHQIDLGRAKSKIAFLAVGKPAALKIRGECNTSHPVQGKLVVQKEQITGKASLKMDHLVTGIELRDSHMRKNYLETGKFPQAILKFTKLPLPEKDSSGEYDGTVSFEGELTLHGQTKPIKGKVELEGSLKELEMDFEFSLNLPEFGIKIPEYLGITVAKKVDIDVHVAATAEPL